MEENPKNRGRRHIINKSKYNKNKPKPNLPINKPKSKSLIPNWERYEEEFTSVNEYIPVGSDFSRLADAPISKGSHFQFKSESSKIEEIEKNTTDFGDLFNIDLSLIGLSLATIPFNERCEISVDYFSVSQQKVMQQTAKNNEKLYKQILMQRGIEIQSIINDYIQSNSSSSIESEPRENIQLPKQKNLNYETETSPIHLEKEENVNISERKSTVDFSKDLPDKTGSQQKGLSSILETESLQEWLDDVLGD